MGLSTILSSSLSSLQAVQTALQVRSDNISNASNTNYAERDPVTVSVGANSVTTTIQRAADQGLQNQCLNANSLSSAAQSQTSYLQQINDVLGTTQSTPYLQQNLDNFTSAWQSFEADTNNSSSEALVVSSGQTLAQNISQTSQQLDQIGLQTSDTVGTMVTNLNSDLTQLDAINKQLQSNPTAATSDPDLLDNRDTLVNNISSIVGVTVISHGDGSVALYTQNGTALVDKTAAQFQWNNPTGAQPWLSLATPAPLAPYPGMNSVFTGGTIGAAMDFLNPSVSSPDPNVGALAKAQAQLNVIASQLSDNVVPSAAAPPGTGTNTFGGAYFAAATTQTTDLLGGPAASYPVAAAVGATAAGTAMSSFFTIDNGSPASQTPAGSIQINPLLASGADTVKADSATAVVAALTSMSRSMTIAQNGDITNGLATINNLSQTSGLSVGMTVTGAGIPAGTTILSISNANGTTITLNQNATASAVGSALTFGLVNPTATNVTYSGLSSAMANYQSTSQSAASTSYTQLNATSQTLTTRLSGQTGVNMDTELAQLTILQNAYGANARVITTVQAMFDSLMGIGT